MDTREANERRARLLLALVYPHLPLTVPTSFVDESWAMTGPALIARITGTLEAIVQLRTLRRTTDETILGRSLYDHATTFAWLAADPSPDRQRRFAKSDADARLKIDDECRALGQPILVPEMRAYFEHQQANLEKRMPNLRQRAQQADRDWDGTIPLGLGSPLNTYEGLYASLYRHHSAYEHPSAQGLLAVADDLPNDQTLVGLEKETDSDTMGLVNALYTYSLLIAGQTLGWPDADDVDNSWSDEALLRLGGTLLS